MRRSADGGLLEWLIAGVEQTEADPWLPFVQWGRGTPLPGRMDVRHRAGGVRLAGIRLDGDPGRLAVWLGSGGR